MLDIKKALKDIMIRLNLINDYVVETGTSGIWTYRKWNSGIAECWGDYVFMSKCNSAWGNGYIGDTLVNLTFPFTFAEIPKLTVTPSHYSGYGCLAMSAGTAATTSTTKTGEFQIFRTSSVGSSTYYKFSFDVKGLWKQLGGVVRHLIWRWSYA